MRDLNFTDDDEVTSRPDGGTVFIGQLFQRRLGALEAGRPLFLCGQRESEEEK